MGPHDRPRVMGTGPRPGRTVGPDVRRVQRRRAPTGPSSCAPAPPVASRVFAAFFTIQASVAVLLAHRAGNRLAVAGFVVVVLAMLAVLVLGLPL